MWTLTNHRDKQDPVRRRRNTCVNRGVKGWLVLPSRGRNPLSLIIQYFFPGAPALPYYGGSLVSPPAPPEVTGAYYIGSALRRDIGLRPRLGRAKRPLHTTIYTSINKPAESYITSITVVLFGVY